MIRYALGFFAILACAGKAERGEPVAEPQQRAEDFACPEGTLERGAMPPAGYRIWCETKAGVSHGPFRAWYPSGKKKTEGAFDNGDAAGEWASWYDNGKLRSRGRYEKGTAVGTWERFDRDGNPVTETIVEAVPEEPSEPARVFIGIPECDLYIERFRPCIDKAPEAARAPLHEALDQTIGVWMEQASGPDRDALPLLCRAAYDAVKGTVQQWGCEM